jgi:hypothetical protein
MNTVAGYVFDTRDPSNPRVIGLKPVRKPQALKSARPERRDGR